MKKIGKAEARYQDRPKVSKRCGTCSMFRPSSSCTLVMGEVSAHGYCRYWETKK